MDRKNALIAVVKHVGYRLRRGHYYYFRYAMLLGAGYVLRSVHVELGSQPNTPNPSS